MKFINLILIMLMLSACSTYDRDFNCPSPGTGACRPLSQTYHLMLKNDLNDQEFQLLEDEL